MEFRNFSDFDIFSNFDNFSNFSDFDNFDNFDFFDKMLTEMLKYPIQMKESTVSGVRTVAERCH